MDSPLIKAVQNQDLASKLSTVKAERHYDVDWLRIIALGLLIVYHIAISFQPWASFIGFMQNKESLEELWLIMSAINVWRIPILFLISGMGFAFAMRRRNWKQLLADRTLRILLPYLFGFFFIAPLNLYFLMQFYGREAAYVPGAWHLWFLLNIFIYVLMLLPFVPLIKTNPENGLFKSISRLFRLPLGILLVAIPVVLEAAVINPDDFPAYAETAHGFWLGFICFVSGFMFILLGQNFWLAVKRHRFITLGLAATLYALRLLYFELDAPNALTGFESMSWMLAILGFGAQHLNKPSKALHYLSEAVYPVYIIHMPIQYALSVYLIPLDISAPFKLVLLLAGTFAASFLLFEILKRLKWIRPLFGMKLNTSRAT